MCEDDELYFRLAAESEIDVIDETLTLKRRHRQHFGDDVTAWRDRRRVFEKMLSTDGGRALRLHTAQTARRDGCGLGKQPSLFRKAPECRRHPCFEREVLLAVSGMVAQRCAHTRSASGPQFRPPSPAQTRRAAGL